MIIANYSILNTLKFLTKVSLMNLKKKNFAHLEKYYSIFFVKMLPHKWRIYYPQTANPLFSSAFVLLFGVRRPLADRFTALQATEKILPARYFSAVGARGRLSVKRRARSGKTVFPKRTCGYFLFLTFRRKYGIVVLQAVAFFAKRKTGILRRKGQPPVSRGGLSFFLRFPLFCNKMKTKVYIIPEKLSRNPLHGIFFTEPSSTRVPFFGTKRRLVSQCSSASSLIFFSKPPAYPVREPLAPTTR